MSAEVSGGGFQAWCRIGRNASRSCGLGVRARRPRESARRGVFGPGCDEQRLPFVTLLSRAADDAGLPDAPEFRAAIMGYAEWGTRFAVHNSQPGAETAAHASVPRWGWGVAPPYEPVQDSDA